LGAILLSRLKPSGFLLNYIIAESGPKSNPILRITITILRTTVIFSLRNTKKDVTHFNDNELIASYKGISSVTIADSKYFYGLR
jgi:hypothetical protein